MDNNFSKQQTANGKQRTANSERQTANGKRQMAYAANGKWHTRHITRVLVLCIRLIAEW